MEEKDGHLLQLIIATQAPHVPLSSLLSTRCFLPCLGVSITCLGNRFKFCEGSVLRRRQHSMARGQKSLAPEHKDSDPTLTWCKSQLCHILFIMTSNGCLVYALTFPICHIGISIPTDITYNSPQQTARHSRTGMELGPFSLLILSTGPGRERN